jgi:hypothetical protein
MPTATKYSGLIERCSFLAYSAWAGLRSDFGVGQLGVGLLERFQLLGRAAHDPHRLAAPFDGHLLARLEGADVHLHGGAGGLGALGGAKVLTKGTAVAAPPTRRRRR